MRARPGLLLVVAVLTLTGCGSSSGAPSEDWATSLCKRMVNNGLEDDAGNPVKPMAVLRARPVSLKDAAKLPGSHIDERGFGEQTDGYLASCKVKLTDPDLVSKVPLPKDAAVVVSESGNTAFITDRF